MSDIFQTCYAFTKGAEGGVSNDPNDPGGLTNTGLTMDDMRRFSRTATAHDLLTLTDAEKQAMYLALYFLPVAGWELPPAVALMVFDHAVNCGVGDSAKLLQRLLLVEDDGQIGHLTLEAMDDVHPSNHKALLASLGDAQEADYRGKADAQFFLDGWDKRLAARLAAAQALLA